MMARTFLQKIRSSRSGVRDARTRIRERRRRRTGAARVVELGMTLIEIMVVVAIIGLMMGGVGIYAFSRWKKAQVERAWSDIRNLQTVLQEYMMHKSECPKDLNALFDAKLIKAKPIDPWGQPFIYKCPGEHDKDIGDISSAGPDKKDSTEDDINSWEEKGSKEKKE
jgi:general secretion pathway protein G